MQNWRKLGSNLPRPPHSMDELLEQCQDPEIVEHFKIEGNQFIHVVPSSCERAGRSIALFTSAGLEAVKGTTQVLMDGTFKFYPSYIKQLFVVHAYVGKYVSIFF